MFLKEETGKDYKVFICLSVRVWRLVCCMELTPQREVFSWNSAYGSGLHLIKKPSHFTYCSPWPSQTAFQCEPTALIRARKSPRTTAGLCEKASRCHPRNPIKTWMCCIKINQGHHYFFSLWFGLPSNYIPCVSEITAPPPLTVFDITLISVSFQNERHECQIPPIINSFNSLICIK